MKSIYKRELRSYFTSSVGYIFISFLLLTVGVYSWYINFLNKSPSFEYVLYNLNFIYLIAVPVLTMRTLAEERRQKTDNLLYSLPLSGTDIVIGKYLAQLTVLLVPTVIISLYPAVLMFFGTISVFTCYSTILGFFLMGAALIAIGIFISSLVENQVVAAIITFAVLFISYLSSTIAGGLSTTSLTSFLSIAVIALLICVVISYVTKNSTLGVLLATFCILAMTLVYIFFPTLFEGAIQKILNSLSLFDRLSYFVTGVLDLTSVVYYITASALMCFLTVQSVEKRRWN